MRSPSICSDWSGRPSFLLTTPAKKPRTECCCQPVAFIIAAMVAPSGRLSSLMTAACLELARDLPWCGFFEAAVLARPLLPIEPFTLRVRLLLAISGLLWLWPARTSCCHHHSPAEGRTALAGEKPEPANGS